MTRHAPATQRLLRRSDTSALLAFEQENRAWFERYIASRGDFFYWHEGVAAHIEQCLADHAAGTMYPTVLEDANGQIIGRANLHAINHSAGGDAKLGYRVAQAYTGQGWASRMAAELVQVAREQGLAQLRSFVVTDNHGSARVLQKLGFVCIGQAQQDAQLPTGTARCDAYLLRLLATPR